MNSTDTKFITNEDGKTLYDRFNTLIKNTVLFDCLVGYFFASGFHLMSDSLKNTKKIRVLVGLNIDKHIYEDIKLSRLEDFQISSKQIKESTSAKVVDEFGKSQDTADVERGANTLLEWLKSKKIEIKAYKGHNLHSKLYVMTFSDDSLDKGRVITGSSNFTEAGLKENLEFNVELKDSPDYQFAKEKFDDLWRDAIDVSETYIATIEQKTWINQNITPYELYLKFLYEYFSEIINTDNEDIDDEYLSKNKIFMKLKYQKDAVNQAKEILESYGGVFLSDVVGLGKTYISAILAKKLNGRSLVIAPPSLLDEDKPGAWPNVFRDFGVQGYKTESLGKLEHLIKQGTDDYDYVFIDEAHRFRTDSTQMYEMLARICTGKKVILVTATPLNNSPKDILSQIALFQNRHHSTLPNPKVRDLEAYFKRLQKKVDDLDRSENRDEYIKIIQENANDIRENVLKYLMVRRTRTGINKYYAEDLKKQNIKFPDIETPVPVYYKFDAKTDKAFDETLNLIIKKFKYSRYMALTYLTKPIDQMELQSQRNMGNFMKGLLLKRLESSFYAFKKSIDRFIESYEKFIELYDSKGEVYISKNISKVFELLEVDDLEQIQKLIDKEDVRKYSSKDFNADFIKHLKEDLKILKEIREMWAYINIDPKLDEFVSILKTDKILKDNKIVVFSESKETVDYLSENLNHYFDNKILSFFSNVKSSSKDYLIDNFDARAKHKKNDYKILITTDILAEGVNLHQSNVVINYDIPWNPIKIMQRMGRINRVDTAFTKLYVYNFFPTSKIDDPLKLKDAAQAKINAFIEMLGNDSKILTDEPIKTHKLFSMLNSKDVFDDSSEQDDDELKYLQKIRAIRDKNPDLFEKIKRLPKKSRSAKKNTVKDDSLISFHRRGKLKKMYITKGTVSEELTFAKVVKIFESDSHTSKGKISKDYFDYLKINKSAFDEVFLSDNGIKELSGKGRSNESQLLKLVKGIENNKTFTEDDEEFIRILKDKLNEGALPPKVIKDTLSELKKQDASNPLKQLAALKLNIPNEYFKESKSSANITGPKEIILSEFLKGNN